jgi:hypothetical protein
LINVPYLVATAIPKEISLPMGTEGTFVAACGEADQLFVIKPYKKKRYFRSAPNELISGLLGKLVNAPVLNPHIIDIDEELIQTIRRPDNYESLQIQSGLAFGTEYYPKSIYLKSFSTPDILANSSDIITGILLDCWLNNSDRDNPGNILVIPTQEGNNPVKYFIRFIDFGMAFANYEWELKDINLKDEVKIQPYPSSLFRFLFEIKDIKNAFNKIESVTKLEIEDIVNSVPTGWNVTLRERKVLVNFLNRRKKSVRSALKNYFVLSGLDVREL